MDRHTCITDCIRRHDCQHINYNIYERRCILSLEACTKLIQDKQYSAIFLGRPRNAELCLMWVPITEQSISRMVPSHDCEFNRIFPETECYVGRIKSPPHILPGKFIPQWRDTVYSVLNGSLHTDGTKEILEVSPLCLAKWMPYSAGNELPAQSVAGGYLRNETGSRLYVIKGRSRRKTVIGYYDTDANKGYVEYRGVKELKHMEMLVLV